MRKILVRFDDICPTMNNEIWNFAVGVMDNYGVKPLIGVIPECCDPELMLDIPRTKYWEYLQELQNRGYKIAMHGVHHVYSSEKRGIVNTKYKSEFAGYSYNEQKNNILYGKKILKDNGISTDVFFAPSHSYDRTTLEVLNDCGFKYMSDGKSLKPIKYGDLIAIPCRNGGMPKCIFSKGYYTVVFHTHEWKDEKDRLRFKKFCEEYWKDIVSFDEYIKGYETGNFIIQRNIEKISVFFDRYIIPILVKIKHTIIK